MSQSTTAEIKLPPGSTGLSPDRSAPVGAAEGLPISVSGIDMSYGSLRVLQDVDLEIGAGEMVVLLGPSGSGKTTLLMAIAGFAKPHKGTIRFGADDVTNLPPERRNIGMIFQNYALFPHMDVASNIAYPLRLRRVDRATIRDKVHKALDLVRLSGLGDRRIDQLSGGQKQRVAVARAIVFSPSILLLDEPLSALDKNLREEMQFELRRIHRDTGATTISVTHDQREALTMADRIAVMSGGRIAQIDTPKGIYESPRSRFVAEFIGDSNVVSAECRQGRIVAMNHEIRPHVTRIVDGQCWIVMRPEKLRLLSGPTDSMNSFSATVVEAIYQGDSCILKAVCGTQELRIRIPATDPAFERVPAPGSSIAIGVHHSDTLLVDN